MNLADLLNREPVEPWTQGGKIPWHEHEFSERMLREHLSQEHDRASRRLEVVTRQVAWIHQTVRGGNSGRVVDLGCGPGLYTARLAGLGHTCLGVDFSPASIAYARSEARRDALRCEYVLQDLRRADLGQENDLVLLVFGEFNTFRTADARDILRRVRHALAPGGVLVLELHDEAFVRATGEASSTWFTARRSVFLDEPHLCLCECRWHRTVRTATERYFVVPLTGDEVATFTSTTQAYSDTEVIDLLHDAGLSRVVRYDSLTGDGDSGHGLFVLVARV